MRALDLLFTLIAILGEHPFPVGVAVVLLAIGIALRFDFRIVDRRDAKIVWSNPPLGPYPMRSFTGPAAKGWNRKHAALIADVERESIEQLAREQRNRRDARTFNLAKGRPSGPQRAA